MFQPRMLRMRWWRSILGAAALAVAAFGLVWLCPAGLWPWGDLAPWVAQRRGHLVRATLERTNPAASHSIEYYRLTSSSGLEVELALRRPAEPHEPQLPLVVLLDGFKSGRDAIERVGDSSGAMLAAVSYPYGSGSREGLIWRLVVSRRLRRTLHDTPAALMLALDFLQELPGVDAKRVELVGVSLGGSLACVTGALDPRFVRVWNIEGGSGPRMLFADQLSRVFRPVLSRPAGAGIGLLYQRLDPADYVERIAPRELVVINGRHDPYFSAEAAARLYARALEPKQLIWLDTGHVNPNRPELIRELMGIVLARIEGRADGTGHSM